MSALLVVLLSYFIAVFWPLEWRLPRQMRNGVERSAGGPALFDKPGLLRSYGSTEWLSNIIRGAPMHIHLKLVPNAPHPRFAGRILAFTIGSSGRLLTIDRDQDALLVRLRGPGTNRDGNPPLRFRHVFEDGCPIAIDLRLVGARLSIAVDGASLVDRTLRYDPRHNWVDGYDVTLGAGLNVRRFFLGSIVQAEVTAGDRRVDLLEPGQLSRPNRMFFLSREPRLTVFEDLDIKDAIQNVLGFIPLGMIAAIWPGATVFSVLATGLAVTGAIEFTQLTVPGRVPSIDDILANTAGAALGWLLVLLLRLMLDRRYDRSLRRTQRVIAKSEI